MNKTLESFLAEHEHKTWTPGSVPKNLWQSDWPWAPVFKAVDQPAINQELDKLRYFFVPHRDNDKINSYGHEGWSALTLHGLDYDKTEHFDQYGHCDQSKYRWTEVCEYCPYIVNLIKSLPFSNYGRIRIMKLSAGGYIMPHTDGAGRIFGPLNFALTHPEGCKFVFKDAGTVPFKIGRGFMLDIGREHVVVNQSEQDRYHIIIHGNPTADITNLISDSIKQL